MSLSRLIIVIIAAFGGIFPALAQESVNVRFADHPTFSRMVFDWQENVDYRPHLAQGKLEITFEKASTPNLSRLLNDPLNFLTDPEYRISDGNLIVSFRLPRPGKLKHFRLGTKIVFDISGDNSDLISPRQQAAQNRAQNKALPSPIVNSEKNARISTSIAQPDNGHLILGVNNIWDNLRLSYPWNEDVRAAAFIRHNLLWVVFEGKKLVDQESLNRFLGLRIISARQIEHPTMTILFYEVTPGQNIKVQRINRAWHVDLKNAPITPARLIASSNRRASGNKGEIFFYSVENAGEALIIEDPVVGDELAIVPVMSSSQGVLEGQKFAEFQSLATAQGIAVQLNADNLSVKSYRTGVSVAAKEGAKQGLALSRSQLSGKLGVITGAEGDTNGTKLVDFAAWEKGPLEGKDYYANKHEFLYMLANSTDTNRNEIRWGLAKFYLANGRSREAFGVLNVMLDEKPRLIDNPEFRTVLAVSNIKMRRYEEGAKLLIHKALLAEEDAFLWRAVANSALGHHERAFKDYKKGSDSLAQQDPKSQIDFLFAAIRSAYVVADKSFIEFSLSFLRNLPLTAAQYTEVDYWRALLARDNGDIMQAEEMLRGLVKAGVRETASWATLDLINMDFEAKKIDSIEAIDQLEKLRFSWRGDDFELGLLSRLGELYVEQNDFNTGLQTLRLAVTFFEGSPKTAALTHQMSQIYSDLFLKGGAAAMNPIKAVALYSEFRELIPLGNDGDNMTRRLADRLVSLDLLEEAAALLNHQVKFRLKGGAQSVVAERLAMIYMLDSKPDMAMGILRATRDSQIPDDIILRRNMIEARALIELGRYEEAEVMLEEYKTEEADSLRADIYWKSENWDKYISLGNQMLGKRYQDDTQLSPQERLAVLRLSVAYVINNDKEGVKVLRNKYKVHMDNGLYGDTFEVITAEKQLADIDVRRLTKSIASVAKLESFMESYKAEFTKDIVQN